MEVRKIVRLLVATGALALTTAVPGTASAAAPDYNQPPTPYDNRGTTDPGCPGQHLTITYRYRGTESIRNVKGSDGQAFLDDNRYHFREVWTDTATGKVAFVYSGRNHLRETSGHRVPKSAVPADAIPPEGLVGPIYRFRFFEKGADRMRDADGTVLYAEHGALFHRALFDTLGDSKPGGTDLTNDVVKVVGPHPLLNASFCAIAAEQLKKG